MAQPTEDNPLYNFRALTMLNLQRSANGQPCDIVPFLEALSVLPTVVQDRIMAQMKAFLTAHRDMRIRRRKNSNSAFNRKLERLERTLDAAERGLEAKERLKISE